MEVHTTLKMMIVCGLIFIVARAIYNAISQRVMGCLGTPRCKNNGLVFKHVKTRDLPTLEIYDGVGRFFLILVGLVV